jgi:hypothetical protein
MLGMDIYSKDLRIRALAAVDRGIPRREVVEIFSISLTTPQALAEDEQGGQGPLARGFHRKKEAHTLNLRRG